MQIVLKRCEKCGQATEEATICDNCGHRIPAENPEDVRITIERPDYDGGDCWDFEFCSMRCMVAWMRNLKLNKERRRFSPFDWEDEIKKKFAKLQKH